MKKGIFAAVILSLAALFLWFGTRGREAGGSEAGRLAPRKLSSLDMAAGDEESARLKTKSSNRGSGKQATHAPERLREFILPAVDIDGLMLGDALRKLMEVYETTCKRTGEIPLSLTFELPPGNANKLHLKLKSANFNSSVQRLAIYAGMKVNRDKTKYRFDLLPDERKPLKQEIQVPPDFALQLAVQAGTVEPGSLSGSSSGAQPFRMPIDKILEASGMGLDPSTRLSAGSSGVLTLETDSGADSAKISAITKVEGSAIPVQNKFETKVFDLAADADWTPPDKSEMTSAELQLFLRKMAEMQGTVLRTLPTRISGAGQSVTAEKAGELKTLKDGTADEYETHNISVVMDVTAQPLGFSTEISYNFTDTSGGIDPATGKAVFQSLNVKNSGFVTDGGTRFEVRTRADGSRMILLITSRMIDAAGLPIHDTE